MGEAPAWLSEGLGSLQLSLARTPPHGGTPGVQGRSSGGGLGLAGPSLVLTAWQTPLLYPCP